MSSLIALIILAATLVTAFLSGIFGMAGGLILMGCTGQCGARGHGDDHSWLNPDGVKWLARLALARRHFVEPLCPLCTWLSSRRRHAVRD